MIQQLAQLYQTQLGIPIAQATNDILAADSFDLAMFMEQVWDTANPEVAATPGGRALLWSMGRFSNLVPPAGTAPLWDHIGYSYVLENTRIVQILKRVVREFRMGEAMGIATPATQRWLSATEALLFGAANPVSAWLSTSGVRPDSEAVRRNLYWRTLGLDLAFGNEDNGAPVYEKAHAANTGFVQLFEELLFELWQAMSNERNTSGANSADDDRIYRIAEQLRYVLRSRRQQGLLSREELVAATALGWAELTVSINTPVVEDLRAQATSAADRLRLIGERVGLPAHGKSAAFFSMAADLSLFLRTIEGSLIDGPQHAWVLYSATPSPADPTTVPIGASSRRVITEWAAATGKDLKSRAKPLDVSRPRLVAVQ